MQVNRHTPGGLIVAGAADAGNEGVCLKLVRQFQANERYREAMVRCDNIYTDEGFRSNCKSRSTSVPGNPYYRPKQWDLRTMDRVLN